MRLERFSVTNYRSIMSARRIQVSDSTVLIGRNNEGKSNILAALAAAMSIVNQLGSSKLLGERLRLTRGRGIYDWDRDFPIPLQDDHPDGESKFRIEFSLSLDERREFKEQVKSNLNENLPIEISLGRGDPKFRVVKRGPGSKTLNRKTARIAKFIGERVEFTHIPAVRTADAALQVVWAMVRRELRALEKSEEYQEAVQRLYDLQQPVLDDISKRIHGSLAEFLPRIKDVSLEYDEDRARPISRRNLEIIVDDGTATSLSAKGDGVQSLAAIGLLRGTSQTDKHLVLALEEPESHLHPGAIHRLRDVVYELAQKHQVVLTTHCPLFVDRVAIGTNIVVNDSEAKPAKAISQIRELLGVRASDNLSQATHVLVVEGASDVVMLRALLSHASTKLARALKNGTLVIDQTHGSGNVAYKVNELQNALCNVHCFLDHDDAGRSAATKVVNQSLLTAAGITHVICAGMTDSEIEDMLNPRIYESWIQSSYGVVLQVKSFRTNKKWSDRVRETFLSQGKTWDSRREEEVKDGVAACVVARPRDALIPQKRGAFDGLARQLEEKLTTASK